MDVGNKIVRTVCYFTKDPSSETVKKVDWIAGVLTENGYNIQTKRICSPDIDKIKELDRQFTNDTYIFGIGSLPKGKLLKELNILTNCKDISFNLDLTRNDITNEDLDVLFEIIKQKPNKTFNFAYVFNNPHSSPYFPSATYHEEGFTIGLQPTDLSQDCATIDEWLAKMKIVWSEIYNLFSRNPDFLGIDSSIAPLFTGKSSLIGFIKKLFYDFSRSATSDVYLRTTEFIKKENPKPIGLCGIMFPCLEDFELSQEYEKGNFSIERNIYLSLHCGLGIDTYPIGIDEKKDRVMEILKLIRGLSNKYNKPLSARFVSDGKAKIGNRTDFQNQYLKDVVIRPL
ncbi:hypothetical protein A2960_05545 [Candidatus Gottesmanbacteria bacterium RIFCSPLOWO2_01_FULL_39_12b]|uniref:DUF711 domain-containing protein n=1 Tax=Candidatus Gottesmanbacteria bacterium RIFCSPLOWO2_01_FULL_39_12b TaxID=1798388 RepID=A0A1F6AP97_9BACT|nr:MAG: hypothetical protein A2960_05545 [Candidatus Gottesmanbacteria bacterium RIFCSPLOWO2_01_FULL_39_12b]